MKEANENLCRCCLGRQTLKNMLHEGMKSASAIKMIEFFAVFSGISDEIASKICKACETKLNASFEFKELIKRSSESLNAPFHVQELIIKEGKY
jgi:tRNA U54 and U55 pseudouridine synthase Pus10